MFRVPRLPRPSFEKGEQEWVREICARASLQAEILSITPLPDNRRTPLAAVRVRLGDVEVVFNLAALRGQRRTVRPPAIKTEWRRCSCPSRSRPRLTPSS